jgi:hypothetical protein
MVLYVFAYGQPFKGTVTAVLPIFVARLQVHVPPAQLLGIEPGEKRLKNAQPRRFFRDV